MFAELWEKIVTTPALLFIVLGLAIFAVVWVLTKLGFLKDGTYKRIGVLVATYLLSHVTPEEASQELTMLFSGALAVLLNEFKNFLAGISSPAPPPPPPA